MKTNGCECTSECGDDPNVQARLVRGCDDYRARNAPERLRADLAAALAERDELRAEVARLNNLRPVVPVVATATEKYWTALRSLVDLMDRLEPDTPDDVREAAETEWDERKAEARALVAEMEHVYGR